MENNEKVLLVGANINDNKDFLNSMIELASLADALELEVINSISQNVKDVTSNFYIGSGKCSYGNTFGSLIGSYTQNIQYRGSGTQYGQTVFNYSVGSYACVCILSRLLFCHTFRWQNYSNLSF